MQSLLHGKDRRFVAFLLLRSTGSNGVLQQNVVFLTLHLREHIIRLVDIIQRDEATKPRRHVPATLTDDLAAGRTGDHFQPYAVVIVHHLEFIDLLTPEL